MNPSNQEKPSPILMLAPLAMVLLGYHYLFHSQLNSDLKDAQQQETALQEKSQNIQFELASAHAKTHTAKKELDEKKEALLHASREVKDAIADKARLRSVVLGENDPGDLVSGSEGRGAPKRVAAPSESSLTIFGQFANMLTSSVAAVPGSQPVDEIGNAGQCHQMNSLCSILDSHRLQRLETSDPSASASGGLVALERKELGRLLETNLPVLARFQMQLEGSFPDLIAALHDMEERLPAVSVISVSLQPIDLETRVAVWKVEVGIRG